MGKLGALAITLPNKFLLLFWRSAPCLVCLTYCAQLQWAALQAGLSQLCWTITTIINIWFTKFVMFHFRSCSISWSCWVASDQLVNAIACSAILSLKASSTQLGRNSTLQGAPLYQYRYHVRISFVKHKIISAQGTMQRGWLWRHTYRQAASSNIYILRKICFLRLPVKIVSNPHWVFVLRDCCCCCSAESACHVMIGSVLTHGSPFIISG